MKKQIFSAAVALAAVAAMSVSAIAVDAGSTNGSATGSQTLGADTAVSITPAGVDNVKVEAPAGVFGEGTLTINISVNAVDAAAAAAEKSEIESKTAATNVTVNTKIAIEALLDGVVVEPNGTVTITVAYDGVSNKVAHVKDDGTIELLDLTVNGTIASFNTTSFSEFYLITATVTGDTNTPTDDKNQATGVAIAVIPAIVAASAIVVSKKRK